MMLSNSQLPETRAERPAGDGSKSTEPSATRTRHEPALAEATPTAMITARLTSATAMRDRVDARDDATLSSIDAMEGSAKLLPPDASIHGTRMRARQPAFQCTLSSQAHRGVLASSLFVEDRG